MSGDQGDDAPLLERVRDYYDTRNELFVKHITTIQAGFLTSAAEGSSIRASNLEWARRAGIKAGERILDAGSGVCGPAIDIARALDVTIDAVTLSQAQVETAKKLVNEAGLSGRIEVHQGDYHALPFPDGTFDRVVCFESVGHSQDKDRLFAELLRVLRPGGELYVKDGFSKEPPLTPAQEEGIEQFRRKHANTFPTMAEIARSIERAGFRDVRSEDISAAVSMQPLSDAMMTEVDGVKQLNELGRWFSDGPADVPLVFGEIVARKP